MMGKAIIPKLEIFKEISEEGLDKRRNNYNNYGNQFLLFFYSF